VLCSTLGFASLCKFVDTMKGSLMLLVAALGSVQSEERFLKSTVSVHKQFPEAPDGAKDIKKGAGTAGQTMQDGAKDGADVAKDGAGKVADGAVKVAKTTKNMADDLKDKLNYGEDGHDGSATKEMNMGEGAYLSGTAVMEATTSKNTDCEDGKWHDCYKKAGDYLDHAPPGHNHGGDGKDGSKGNHIDNGINNMKDAMKDAMKGMKSDAPRVSFGLGLMVTVALAVQV
jgi:hypothetical protein